MKAKIIDKQDYGNSKSITLCTKLQIKQKQKAEHIPVLLGSLEEFGHQEINIPSCMTKHALPHIWGTRLSYANSGKVTLKSNFEAV